MKRRTVKRAAKEAWKRNIKTMSEADRETFQAHRIRTAPTGYAKRQRERDNGAPMAARPPAWHAELVARDMRMGYAYVTSR